MAHLSSIQLGKLTRLSLNELVHRSIYTTSLKVNLVEVKSKLRNNHRYGQIFAYSKELF